jgi:hypothetical protein
MLGALQGGAFARQVLSSFKSAPLAPIAELPEEAALMAVHLLASQEVAPETLVGVVDQLQRRAQREQIPQQTIADCVAVAIRMSVDNEPGVLDFRSITIDGANLGKLSFDEVAVRGLSLRNCVVKEVAFGADQITQEVSFSNCLIARVSGASNWAGLPKNSIASDCAVDEFDNMGTNNAVLRLAIDPRLKALITVLRKLYKQRGAGRKLAAFKRGITSAEVLRYIDPVLNVLSGHQFVSVFNSVVHPVRKQASRVEKILAAPTLSDDSIVIEVRKL